VTYQLYKVLFVLGDRLKNNKKEYILVKITLELNFWGLNNSLYSTGGHAIVPWVTFISPTGLSKKSTARNFSTKLQNRSDLKNFLHLRQPIRRSFILVSKIVLAQ
jgi:hypothetical protein